MEPTYRSDELHHPPVTHPGGWRGYMLSAHCLTEPDPYGEEYTDCFGVSWSARLLGYTDEQQTDGCRLWLIQPSRTVLKDAVWQSMKRWEAPWWRRLFRIWKRF